ncbi:threonine/serine exporter family protein [Angelakisella massiliensis]|uniref:threonine/serine exporter family protein n=1 Tax=Angelakisella massiliensis TaxID=1871018 RepID=UPI0008F89D22|nr:threonine/serine exporter family protein [Angelakisella massiliensis]
MLTNFWLPCFYATLASTGFCIIFNIRRPKRIFFAALGGGLAWAVYLLAAPVGSDLFQYFAATIALSMYAEVMARIFKCPATEFLLVALIPLVPGGGIYHTMEYCIQGDTSAFLETGLHTLGIAASLAVGILLVSSAVRLYQTVKVMKRR